MTVGKIESAAVAAGHRLALRWDDGRQAEVDFEPIIAGHPVLAPLRDSRAFRQARLTDDGWSVEWACGIDFGAPQLRRWADEQAGEIMAAAAFRDWMARHRLTLDGAAEALGLARRTIAYYLSGERPVPKTVMLATVGYDHRQAA